MVVDDYTPNGDESGQNKPDGGSAFSTSLAGGIVVSSRVRLARNIAEFPFLVTCSKDQRAEIESAVRAGFERNDELSDLLILDSEGLDALERQFLVDLKAVTGTHPAAEVEASHSGSVGTESAKDRPENTRKENYGSSVMVNEEDHLRIQVVRAGLDLETAWTQANQLDDLIEQNFSYAFSPRWGYLTACPANVGTGLRVSVWLHLPGLVLTGRIDKEMRALNRLNVSGREMFGDPAGEFFRISNQATLGWGESELIDQVENAVALITEAERDAREHLLAEEEEFLKAEISLSLGKLLNTDLEDATAESHLETTQLLSRVRMGIGMGLLKNSDSQKVAAKFELVRLRQRLAVAVSHEDYQQASEIRDQIDALEEGAP